MLILNSHCQNWKSNNKCVLHQNNVMMLWLQISDSDSDLAQLFLEFCKSWVLYSLWDELYSWYNCASKIILKFTRLVQSCLWHARDNLPDHVFLLNIYKRSQNNPETLRRSLEFFGPEQSSASCAPRNANKHTASLLFVFTTRNDRRLIFVVSPLRKAKKKDILVFDTENGESKLAATKLSNPVVF